MVMSLIAVTALAAQCAPSVAPQTLLAVVRVESGFDPLAIGVNGPQRTQLHPGTVAEATTTAERLISQGVSIDLGLGQINSKTLSALGLTVSDAFDPCSNLEGVRPRVAGRLCNHFSRDAGAGPRRPQGALNLQHRADRPRIAQRLRGQGDGGGRLNTHRSSPVLDAKASPTGLGRFRSIGDPRVVRPHAR